MTVWELLFILLFLASAAAVVTAVILVFNRRPLAKRILVSVSAVWGVYLSVLAVADVTASQSVTKAGADRCFDEMCFAVAGVDDSSSFSFSSPFMKPGDVLYIVTIRVTSHSRGRPQAEGGIRARLYENGKFFDVFEPAEKAYEAQHGQTPKLTQRLAPGERVLSVLVFNVPRESHNPALTLDHGFTPGFFVIGESPFFHEPDILELPRHVQSSLEQSPMFL